MDTGQEPNRYMANLSEGLTKEVTYPVGFNDLSYFPRGLKLQFGVCPSNNHAGARSS